MTMREIVKKLKEMGFFVDYRVRRDGSIRITRIEGNNLSMSFKSNLSQGNEKARQLAGQPLSKYEKAQREFARTKQSNPFAFKNQPIDFQNFFKTAQRAVDEVNKQRRKQGLPTEGRITWQKTRAGFFLFGAEQTKEHLDNIVQMAKGYAPDNFVLTLQTELQNAENIYPEFAQEDLSNKVDAKRRELPAEGVRMSIHEMYLLDKNIKTPAEVVSAVKKLLGL